MQSAANTLRHGGWTCKYCGKTNPPYFTKCFCGRPRLQEDTEAENLKKLKSYKELLYSGAISQEEFDERKKQLLNF